MVSQEVGTTGTDSRQGSGGAAAQACAPPSQPFPSWPGRLTQQWPRTPPCQGAPGGPRGPWPRRGAFRWP